MVARVRRGRPGGHAIQRQSRTADDRSADGSSNDNPIDEAQFGQNGTRDLGDAPRAWQIMNPGPCVRSENDDERVLPDAGALAGALENAIVESHRSEDLEPPMPFIALLMSPLLFAPQTSDVKLTGTTLVRFLKTGGGSHHNSNVYWRIPARVFRTPAERRNGHDIFIHEGVALTIRSTSRDLAELRRRGGVASVRGRVIRIPKRARRKNGPRYAIAIRQLRPRRR